jgi:hypothetical protein
MLTEVAILGGSFVIVIGTGIWLKMLAARLHPDELQTPLASRQYQSFLRVDNEH